MFLEQVRGLGVDELLSKEDIVVKPLDRLVRQSRVFAGFTILGDGRPALILDVNGLFDSVAGVPTVPLRAGEWLHQP